MNAEYLRRHYSCDGEAVEYIDEGLPRLDITPSLAFVVKAIYSRNIGTLMIAPKQEEVLRILDLVAQQEKDGFQTLLSSIDVVSEEQVVGRRWKATHLEESNEVRVLSVHVADNLDRRRQLNESWLTEEDFACSLANGHDLRVLET